jgi:hypothetical protein
MNLARMGINTSLCNNKGYEYDRQTESVTIAVLICWKPSNIFIKLTLKHFSVNMPREMESGFCTGKSL